MSQERKEQPAYGPPGRGPGWRGHGIGMPVQKAKDFKGTLFRLIRYFKPHVYRLLTVFLAALVGTLFGIISPRLIGDATTQIFQGIMKKMHGVPGGGIDFGALSHIVAILIGLYLLSSLFSYIQQYVMAGVAQQTVYALRKEVNEKLSHLPLQFFDSRPNGEILSRFINDFDNIGNTLQQSLTQLITSLITFVGVIVMMLSISPLMTLVTALTLPLGLYVTRAIAKRSQIYFVGQQKSLGELNGHVEEMYTGHTIVKAFGHEEKSIAKFEEINARLYESGWKAQYISGIIMPLMNSIGNLGYVFVSVVGGVLVTKRAIEIGDVQAFIQYARQFTQPITQLSSIANIIQSTIASAERVFELLDEPEELPEPENPKALESPSGAVQFENVQFGYKPGSLLIKDMNIQVKPGQMIAVVGPTGAGKTTLINLLMRFYEIGAGKITVDGVDITQMNRGRLRQLFGMVLQDAWLFNATIRENIAYGLEGASEEEVVQAAAAAHADHFIRTLPDGYDTVINEEATNISQGQKQLLTIARAFLSDPAILILDEATSSVDSRTEAHIQKAMGQLMKGRTSFVIAHRLSTIREADLILVMNHGSVVEQGTHLELLEKRGFYAELYNSQFAVSAAV